MSALIHYQGIILLHSTFAFLDGFRNASGILVRKPRLQGMPALSGKQGAGACLDPGGAESMSGAAAVFFSRFKSCTAIAKKGLAGREKQSAVSKVFFDSRHSIFGEKRKGRGYQRSHLIVSIRYFVDKERVEAINEGI